MQMMQCDLFPPELLPPKPATRSARKLMRAEAAALRDNAIERAKAGANRAVTGWSDKAFAVLCTHLFRIGVDARFQVVDIRLGAYLLDDPPEPRAWGAIAVRASRLGLIARDGVAPCNDPRQHLCPTTVWRVAKLPK
jgi:hypothetical protein